LSLEDNKTLVERFINEVMNAGNTASIADLCVTGSMFAGGIEGQIGAMKSGFPDNHFAIDDILAEGNKVAVRVTIHGTNSGPLVGLPAFGRFETPVPPTGKSVIGTGMYLFTVSEGKILSYASEIDQIALLRQMGWSFTPPAQDRE
jgi:predicted ester cyclase